MASSVTAAGSDKAMLLVSWLPVAMSRAKRQKEWFDNDAFWRELYAFLFPKERFAAADAQVAKALALAKPSGKSVLDLCCGPGRCSIALAKRGFSVTGVDRTNYLLDKARAGSKSARVRVEWVREDMRDFVRANSFDLVLSMFTSFGYFNDKREDLLVLENIFKSLKPGGACLIELLGKEYLAKIFQPTISDLLPDGTVRVQRHEIFDDWTRVRNEWLLIKDGRAKHFQFHHRVYSGQELRDLLERAGLANVTLYGSMDGAEYGRHAERLIAVARKPFSKGTL